MTDEKIKQYLGKKVEITFFDNSVDVGILGEGDCLSYGVYWFGKGYHLDNGSEPRRFRKSHVKKIKEVEVDD